MNCKPLILNRNDGSEKRTKAPNMRLQNPNRTLNFRRKKRSYEQITAARCYSTGGICSHPTYGPAEVEDAGAEYTQFRLLIHCYAATRYGHISPLDGLARQAAASRQACPDVRQS